MELTKSEEKIMLILWKLERAFLKEIMKEITQFPKPHPNSILSTIRGLTKKKVVSYKIYGRNYQYFPVLEQSEIAVEKLEILIKNYFKNSPELLSETINEFYFKKTNN